MINEKLPGKIASLTGINLLIDLLMGLMIRLLIGLMIGLIFLAAVPLQAEEISLTILHTNDEHSEIIPHSPSLDYGQEIDRSIGGMARLAGAVNQIKADRKSPVLLFNAGDFIGGTPFSWLASRGIGAEIAIMKEIGYDAVVPGNHEFDYGVEVLQEYLDYAGYPESHEETAILGSNIISPEGYFFQDYYLEEKIIELEELKIGVFGLIGEDAGAIAPDPGQLEFADPYETAARKVEELQSAGADLIIALTHSGLAEDKKLAGEVAGLDLIIGGHSHHLLEEPRQVDDTLIFQAGAYLEYLGVLDLVYDTGEKKIAAIDYRLVKLDADISSTGEDASLGDAPVGEEPIDYAPVEEGPVEYASDEYASVRDLPVDNSPDEYASVRDAPDKEASDKDASLEYSPEDVTPVKEASDEYEYASVEDAPDKESPEISEMINHYSSKLNQLIAEITGGEFGEITAPVARSDFPLRKEPYAGENQMGSFVTDAMRIIAQEELGEEVDIAFQGAGQIRGSLIPDSEQGRIALYDMISPASMGKGPGDNFGFPLVTAHLTGAEVETLLEVAAFLPQVAESRHFIHFSGLRYSFNPENAVLFDIPILDFPLLTTRAVTSAEIFTGRGKQTENDEDYEAFEEEKLYRLVTDSHMLAQISLVESFVPWLDLKPRDEEGNVIDVDDIKAMTIPYDKEFGEENNTGNLKVWQAVVRYADSFEGEDLPEIPAYYAASEGRITETTGLSYRTVLLTALLIVILVLVLLLSRWREKRGY